MLNEKSKASDADIEETGTEGVEVRTSNKRLLEPVEISNKKLQYLEQDILDRRGVFKYTDDPTTYKKARKRLQNRESAVRSRSRKANELAELREEVARLKQEREE